jgi:hypothetical protein
MDTSVTSAAVEGLNGLPIGDKQLTVRIANPTGTKATAAALGTILSKYIMKTQNQFYKLCVKQPPLFLFIPHQLCCLQLSLFLKI